MAEYSLLVGVKLKEVRLGSRTRQAILAKIRARNRWLTLILGLQYGLITGSTILLITLFPKNAAMEV